MTFPAFQSDTAKDSALAGVLVASPAWVPWLSDLNEVLTTITLFCGAALGIERLWLFVKRWLKGRRSA